MKTRLLTLAAIGFLTTLIIYSCSVTGGAVSTLKDTICMNYADINTLEVRLIHEMRETYKLNQLRAINTGTSTRFTAASGAGDATAIWFDLETLKQFIYQIETKAKNNANPVPNTDLGVRIYYASYPDFGAWGTYPDLPGNGNNVLTSDYQERHTVVMIPTMRRNGVEVDFNPLDPPTYSEPLISSARYSNVSSTQILAISGIPSSGSTGAQNHGGLYPPRIKSGMGF